MRGGPARVSGLLCSWRHRGVGLDGLLRRTGGWRRQLQQRVLLYTWATKAHPLLGFSSLETRGAPEDDGSARQPARLRNAAGGQDKERLGGCSTTRFVCDVCMR